MNLPGVLMGVAAGIGIHAALTHGLVGFARRPRDRARIAFAAASAAAAVAALAVLAMYSAESIGTYVAITKWVFYPASIAWTVATVWFVAFYTDVRPRGLLLALTTGFCVGVAIDFTLSGGLLHEEAGELVMAHVLGGAVMVTSGSSAHVLHYLTDALTVAAFVYLCYAVYEVYRRHAPARAGYLGAMTVLLAVATLLDTINEHSIVTTFTTLYLTQICFAAVIVAVSLVLRRDSLRVEAELRLYQTQLDSLVELRVAELDEANAQLAVEARERRATEEMLRRRVTELDALRHIAQVLAGRSDLGPALDEATHTIERLFEARYARVQLLTEDGGHEANDAAAVHSSGPASGDVPAGGATSAGDRLLDAAVTARVLKERATIASDGATWPGLPEGVRRRVEAEGIGQVLAVPLITTEGPVGALVIARDEEGTPFSTEERQLARTVGEALGGVIEIDRLHRRETREAAQEERQALARDLHDAVTQSIYSASLIAEALPAVWEREPEEGLHNLERLRRLVRAALAEMRTLLFELRPTALEAAPLDALLDRLGDSLGGQVQIPVDIHVDDADLPPDVKLAFYRVTQEAFSNITKHARAQRVTVAVRANGDGATLTVEDDGRGFDPDGVPSGHMGLHIMRERLERVGAALTVESSAGRGTTIRADWPRPASDEPQQEREGA